MEDCTHEYLVVETTEKVAQYYDPILKEWGDKLDWEGPVLSINVIECADCHAEVTEQFKAQIAKGLGVIEEPTAS